MNYNFEFNSPAIGRIQPFEYSYMMTNEYAFTYGRDIFSDLSKFNAPIFVMRKKRGIFSYNKIYLAKKPNNKLEKEKYKAELRINDSNTDITENLFINEYMNNLYASKDVLYTNKEFFANIFKEIIMSQDNINANVFDSYFGEKSIPKKITIVDMKSSKKNFSLEIYDDYFLSYHNKILDMQQGVLLKTPIEKLNINQGTFLKEPDNMLNIYDTILLFNPINTLSVYKDYMLSKAKENILNTYNNYFAKTPIKEMIINNNFMMSEIDVNKTFINKIISVLRNINELNLYEQILATNNSVFNSNVYNNYFVQKPYTKETYIQKSVYMGIKQKRNTTLNYKFPALAKYKRKLIMSKDIILGYHSKRKICFRKENLFVYKFNHDLFIKEDILLSKDKHGFRINNTELYLTLLRKSFNIKDNTEFLYKDSHSFVINNSEKFLYKDHHGFVINNTEKFLYKNRYGFSINDTEYFLYKNRKGFIINDTEYIINKFRKGFNFDDYTNSIYRDKYSFSINVTEVDLAKIELPVDIITHNNTIGFILSEKDLYKESNNQALDFNSKSIFTKDTTLFLDKDNKHSSILENIFIVTEQKRVFLEYYHNLMLSKNTKEFLLDMTNKLIEKETKNGIIYQDVINVTKYNKNLFIDKDFAMTNLIKKRKSLSINEANIFVTKVLKESYLYSDILLGKVIKSITLLNDIWINKETHIVNIFENNFISKNVYEVYVQDNEIFVDKTEYDLTENTYLDIKTKQKETYKNKDAIGIAKESYKSNINDYIFITKQQYESNFYVSEMMHMQKVIKDLERPVEKTYNWAYVYQYEDPIDPNYDYYGIDELLLPEKDIDYSHFEDIIFNKKTMTPRRPIKIIDNNTFIAKYPVRHPTPDYEEVGIVYIDVPTSLMYAIFTKFYQIWYANIFKFGNMSMIDSLKLMLEYMYAHIVTTYSGTEYLEPALRVFRQIRWFGETSVMHNAQYKITCEFEDLKSNLQTGECAIKNQLSGFYIDTKLKVLSVDPTSIGQEAYIKLYASNREESQINFSISLTSGSVDIYINDEHIDTIYSNHAFISYELPATDTENEIVLKRSATNNIGYCYVGNIIIKNGTYKNLNIEYDPELKAGNMPLNDIVNKMVILANMYDDEQEVFEQFRKGNLAISELYKKLENYWEFHHANKVKGKRLTIKET